MVNLHPTMDLRAHHDAATRGAEATDALGGGAGAVDSAAGVGGLAAAGAWRGTGAAGRRRRDEPNDGGEWWLINGWKMVNHEL